MTLGPNGRRANLEATGTGSLSTSISDLVESLIETKKSLHSLAHEHCDVFMYAAADSLKMSRYLPTLVGR